MDRFDLSRVRPAFRPKRYAAIRQHAIRHLAAHPASAAVASLALVVLICLADLATGYGLTLSILYLVPVFLTTWFAGLAAGLGMAVASTIAWFVMDVHSGHEYSHAFYRYWEALIKLIIFAIFAAMLARLKLALARSDERLEQQREQLEATARLVAVGEMASMLAHQINQPLSAVVNYCKSCLRRLRSGSSDPATLAEIMEQASQEAARASAIIQRVREFVRKREPNRAPTEINSLVEGTLALMRAEAAKHGVTLAFEPAAALPWADADGVMVEQILMNLLRNGMEAMDATPVENRELRILTAADAAGFVHVSVHDRGCGVPAGFAENMAQPFFTTKRRGMGLGLSICRSIVEFHGGSLWATSDPQGGSAFHFTLPVAQARA